MSNILFNPNSSNEQRLKVLGKMKKARQNQPSFWDNLASGANAVLKEVKPISLAGDLLGGLAPAAGSYAPLVVAGSAGLSELGKRTGYGKKGGKKGGKKAGRKPKKAGAKKGGAKKGGKRMAKKMAPVILIK